jgi:hypothetical protein
LKNILKLLLANFMILIFFLIIVEVLGQIHFLLHPEYENYCGTLNKKMGWKLAPNCNFIFTGGRYNAEFKTEISTNSNGFRDKERTIDKPKNTIRIAFMGDSMVEALHVPLENAASQVLEKKLNEMDRPKNVLKFEVLNFGVGNYGLGQMFLTYKNIASKFDPDFVLIFINEYLMERTIEYQLNESLIQQNKYKSNRPVFQFAGGKKTFFNLLKGLNGGQNSFFQSLQSVELNWRPSKGFKANEEAEKPIQGNSGFGLEIVKTKKLFLSELFTNILRSLKSYVKNEKFKILKETNNSWQNRTRLFINFKILDEFNDSKITPSKIILLDSSKYYDQALDRSILSIFLENFSKYKGYSYANISDVFLEAEEKGVRIRWIGDPHFNEQGQNLFGEAVFRTLKPHLN